MYMLNMRWLIELADSMDDYSADSYQTASHTNERSIKKKMGVVMNHQVGMGPKGDVKILRYKPHTNHKKQSVSSHTLAPTTICDLSHSVCRSPLTDLGHINSVTYVCLPLWFV